MTCAIAQTSALLGVKRQIGQRPSDDGNITHPLGTQPARVDEIRNDHCDIDNKCFKTGGFRNKMLLLARTPMSQHRRRCRLIVAFRSCHLRKSSNKIRTTCGIKFGVQCRVRHGAEFGTEFGAKFTWNSLSKATRSPLCFQCIDRKYQHCQRQCWHRCRH